MLLDDRFETIVHAIEEGRATFANIRRFLTSLGFRPGGAPPTAGALAIASGAAFTTIVVAQCAVALACRSWSRPGWQVPARTNPLVFAALAVSSSLAALLVGVPPLARLLGHVPPTAYGMLLALSAFPVVLAADAAHKAWLRRGTRRTARA